MPGVQREIAFYYPGPMWHAPDWIKTLILFFDGVGLLLPDYMRGKPEFEDPAIALPLRDKGLLHILEPEKIVDKKAAEKLSNAMAEVMKSGVLDRLDKHTRFHEISYSRLGGSGDERLAKKLLETLKKKGLARDTEDGKSIPMHPMVRSLILVLLSQILRPYGEKLGAELSPATDRPEVMEALRELLSVPDSPSSAHVVAMDLETVSVDLSLVPIDEVLAFREEHKKEHRAYVKAVRNLAKELGKLKPEEREDELKDRREELQSLANDLKTLSRKSWKRPASFALGMAGAAWKLKTHDYIGALLAASAGIVGMRSKEKVNTGAAPTGPSLAFAAHLLAQYDGATIISVEGRMLRTGVHLNATQKAHDIVRPLSGLRHTSAKRASFDYPATLVVTVSSDGPVTIFSDGMSVFELRWYSADADAQITRRVVGASNRDLVMTSGFESTCANCGKTSDVEILTIAGYRDHEEACCPVCAHVIASDNCFQIHANLRKVF